MGLFDNGLRLGTGVAVGIGALILAPTIIPVVSAIIRPLAKATIKSGLILIEKGKEVAAEAKEALEDLAAEAQAEIAQEQTRAASHAAAQSQAAESHVITPG